jgi:UDP-glucose 4-epimerase
LRRILITGVAGFIGSYLAEYLIKQGNSVIGVDNLSNGSMQNLKEVSDSGDFKFVQLDVRETNKMLDILLQHEVTEVWHLAANTDIISSHDNPKRDFQDCAEATFSVLEAMRGSFAKRIIFASSGSVYGPLGSGIAVPEIVGPLKPMSTYGAGKLASEAFISAYSNLYDIDAFIFRFGNVLGDRINHGVVYDFVRKLMSDPARLQIRGDGSQEKNYFLVSDCIAGMDYVVNTYSFADSERALIVNLGNSTLTNVQQIARIVIAQLGLHDVEISIEGTKLAWPGDQPIVRLDCSLARSFGWDCEQDSDSAVRITAKQLYLKFMAQGST